MFCRTWNVLFTKYVKQYTHLVMLECTTVCMLQTSSKLLIYILMGSDYDQYFKLSDIILNIPTGLDDSKYAVMTDSLCSRLT